MNEVAIGFEICFAALAGFAVTGVAAVGIRPMPKWLIYAPAACALVGVIGATTIGLSGANPQIRPASPPTVAGMSHG
jgi:hypothetical protein